MNPLYIPALSLASPSYRSRRLHEAFVIKLGADASATLACVFSDHAEGAVTCFEIRSQTTAEGSAVRILRSSTSSPAQYHALAFTGLMWADGADTLTLTLPLILTLTLNHRRRSRWTRCETTSRTRGRSASRSYRRRPRPRSSTATSTCAARACRARRV